MRYLLFLLVILMVSCTPENKQDTEKQQIFDPEVPGGTSSSNPITKDVLGLKADVEYNRVYLSWISPNIYKNLKHYIHIYKTPGTQKDFILPDPKDKYSGSFLYYIKRTFVPFEGNEYLVNNENDLLIAEGETYTFHVYVEKDGMFSDGKSITVTIPFKEQTISPLNNDSFWKAYSSKIGRLPNEMFPDIGLDTLNAGASTINRLKGQMAWNDEKTLLYITDTDNNRVMIYANTVALECYTSGDGSQENLDLCLYLSSNAPLTPYAVLGQNSFLTNYSCQDADSLPNNMCFTAPTGVIVKDNKLFVSDSGNNRVVIFDEAPSWGCYNIKNLTAQETPTTCEFDRVIGKKGVEDLTDYPIGKASLKSPNGLAFHNNYLYIADTEHNRVVVANNTTNSSLWECETDTWESSKCSFYGVLGQQSFTESEHFKEKFDNGEVVYDFITKKIDDKDYLKRHFRNPIDVHITDSSHLIVASNEDFSFEDTFSDITLYTRYLIFKNLSLEGAFPDCTSVTYDDGSCDADFVLGQYGFDGLSVTPFGRKYTDENFTVQNHGGMDTFGNVLYVTDATDNIITSWNDYTSEELTQLTPDLRVLNPEGEWDSDKNRALPDLMGLGAVMFNPERKSLYIFDSKGSALYQTLILE